MAQMRIVTFLGFTCQLRGAFAARMSKFQCFSELAALPNRLENRLFLANVTMPAELLQLSESWLNKARLSGSGPRYHKMGSCIRYSLQALEEFKRANARGSTSEYDSHSGPGRPPKKGE
jgi:4-diphosphocytidyl-2C-methyl-D-erythritol kinase